MVEGNQTNLWGSLGMVEAPSAELLAQLLLLEARRVAQVGPVYNHMLLGAARLEEGKLLDFRGPTALDQVRPTLDLALIMPRSS